MASLPHILRALNEGAGTIAQSDIDRNEICRGRDERQVDVLQVRDVFVIGLARRERAIRLTVK